MREDLQSNGQGNVGKNLMERSALHRQFMAEREQILRHKWLESEKAGRDIGFNAALISWVIHHRTQWRERQARCTN